MTRQGLFFLLCQALRLFQACMQSKPIFLDVVSNSLLFGYGMWRSPVAHLHGVQGVAGSNPVIPTI